MLYLTMAELAKVHESPLLGPAAERSARWEPVPRRGVSDAQKVDQRMGNESTAC